MKGFFISNWLAFRKLFIETNEHYWLANRKKTNEHFNAGTIIIVVRY